MNSNNGSFCTISLSTVNSLDLTNYRKIGADVTIISNGYTGGIEAGGYTLGISNQKITSIESPRSGFLYANDTSQETGENKEIWFEIEEYNEQYFVGLKNARYHMKIHSIWLE